MLTYGPNSAITSLHFDEFARNNPGFKAYFDPLPFVEFDAVQIDSGPFDHESIEIWGQNTILVRDRLTPMSAFTMVPQPDWVMFLLPNVWKGDFRVAGQLSDPGDVFYLDAEQEWFTAAAARDTLSLGVRRSVLSKACANLLGVDFVDLTLGSHTLANGAAITAVLYKIYTKATAAADEVGFINGRLIVPPVLEADMISELASALNQSTDSEAMISEPHRGSLYVVSRARDALRKAGPAAVSIANLCEEVGVSRTWLHHSFIAVFGISAGQYLKLHRLSLAREYLLNSTISQNTVKNVSIGLGFSTSGRFAREYRALFGEYPSDTLGRVW
ncbi:hypothetical protein AVO44_08360 [Ruegeria profundi]|uniref:HTH araC/xylS-type domain-containing protein n=2 Tax=Ruegeria profundi TaxID=1685378 RepID=A0A0X3TVZ5_9RHOB|nr:hypothetical protein AVO44_08360 [Ruegeria profundi]